MYKHHQTKIKIYIYSLNFILYQSLDLKRCFGLLDLTFLAISGMVGSGLYVLVGTVAKNTAGPSIVISYVLAAIASILSATCYAGKVFF